MKKLMKVVLLVSAALMLASCGSTPKAEKITAGSVKLDPQALFEFEGVRAESINWANARVTINGMIVWSWAMEGATCYETGWNLRGVDLSGYDGIVGVSADATFRCNYKSKQSGSAVRYNKRFSRDSRIMTSNFWRVVNQLNEYVFDNNFRLKQVIKEKGNY